MMQGDQARLKTAESEGFGRKVVTGGDGKSS